MEQGKIINLEEEYLKISVKELVDECKDFSLLYLIRGLLSVKKESGS